MNNLIKYGGYALITGVASGIGRGFAGELAKQGYDLVLVDMNEENLKIAAKVTNELIPDQSGNNCSRCI